MATFNFDEFVEAAKQGIVEVAKTETRDFLQDTQADGEAFLESTKQDLLVWTQQLADGLLSKEEFEFLVKGQKDLAKMEALTRAGVGAAKIDAVRTGVINAVLTAAMTQL